MTRGNNSMDKNKNSQRILIADAKQDSAMFFDINLSRHGYETLVASSSEEALQLASSSSPAIIVAQLALKPKNGSEFCWMLRQAKYLRAVPVILLVPGKATAEIELRAHRHGVDAVLANPMSIRELIGRMEALLWRFAQLMQMDKATTDLLYTDAALEDSPVIQADLKNFNLLEAVQFFNMNKKTGTLVMQKDDESGQIIMQNGEVKYAETGGYSGEEAAYRLAIWREGTLRFFTTVADYQQNIDKPTIKLILDCCTVLDMENFVIKS